MKAGIRLIGILIAVAVVNARAAFNYGIELLSVTEHPIMMVQGFLELSWWLSGITAAVLLLFVHSAGKWVLLSFFLLGLVATWISWVPFVWDLVNLVELGMYKFTILHGANLIILLLAFFLFNKLDKQSNKSFKPDAKKSRAV